MSGKRRIVWSADNLRVLLVRSANVATVVVETNIGDGHGKPLWVEVHQDAGSHQYDAAVRLCITALADMREALVEHVADAIRAFPTSGESTR